MKKANIVVLLSLVVGSWSSSSFAGTDHERNRTFWNSDRVRNKVAQLTTSVPRSIPSKVLTSALKRGILSANKAKLNQLESIFGGEVALVRAKKSPLHGHWTFDIVGANQTVRFEQYLDFLLYTNARVASIRAAKAREIRSSQNLEKAKKAAARSRTINKIRNGAIWTVVVAAVVGAAGVMCIAMEPLARYGAETLSPY